MSKIRTFGWTKSRRAKDGEIIGSLPAPVRVRTIETLGGMFGTDRNRRLIVTAHAGDVLGLRPEMTGREVKIKVMDVYTYALRCQANLVHLELARKRKEAKAIRLAAARQARAEKKLFS